MFEPDVKHNIDYVRNTTEFYFCSQWIFAFVLVYLHGDYVSVPYNSGFLPDFVLLRKNLNVSKPPEQSKGLGGNIGC